MLGTATLDALARTKVAVFGLGGVGSWCAESLVRSGIGKLLLVDSDRVCITNVNRQLMATTKTAGQVKVEVLARRLKEINPLVELDVRQRVLAIVGVAGERKTPQEMEQILADTLLQNTRSQRVLTKLGFRCVGADEHFKYYELRKEQYLREKGEL